MIQDRGLRNPFLSAWAPCSRGKSTDRRESGERSQPRRKQCKVPTNWVIRNLLVRRSRCTHDYNVVEEPVRGGIRCSLGGIELVVCDKPCDLDALQDGKDKPVEQQHLQAVSTKMRVGTWRDSRKKRAHISRDPFQSSSSGSTTQRRRQCRR